MTYYDPTYQQQFRVRTAAGFILGRPAVFMESESPKETRYDGALTAATRRCGVCKQHGHDRRNCPQRRFRTTKWIG